MTIEIDRLVVFGDSLSDIGQKRKTSSGRLARLLGLMRTNEVGRFSDTRNWTDFIWEWSGGTTLFEKDAKTTKKLTKHHLTINSESSYGCTPARCISYANYAEGGAMGGSDRSGIGLGTFSEQTKRFLHDEKTSPPSKNTLFLIWFGLNDLVTNGRNKSDMKKVAIEITTLCEELLNKNSNSYFIFANIPNPQGSVRYFGKELTEEVRDYQQGAFEFGYELARQVTIFPDTRASLLDMYSISEYINDNLDVYGLKKGSQPHGMKVKYGSDAPISSDDFFVSTSDRAHPTEQVYKLIANAWSEEILKRFDLGTLRIRNN
ncbi:SGNH/GDSL hydrolase family protein [Shewanella waksmanii]|uniref:SGNH/GDSL hydrolase family protein n=1 Tax=Shewanella waksmanii TaxID=213783 RepID=UPI00048C70B3|nr:SGNH/GDSL hydrolase family protein [Shewanella waksmanii]